MKKLLTLFMALCAASLVYGQGVTTSSMSGYVTEESGEPMIGATVLAKHIPTGSVYGTVTDIDGSYRLSNMRVGGPYELKISFTGFSEQTYSDIYLRLGERYRKSVVLQESNVMLDDVVVTAQRGSVGENSGASTQITEDAIEEMPTLNRNVQDYLRLTPQASTNNSGGISFAGINNRYNAIYIDGAVNNDVFGLSSDGTNGGQTGIAPFSIDIIDQFQVVLSPYDVTLGGFAGGGVNAVTKSGTNQFAGTAYYFTRNENMVGKTNGKVVERFGLEEREKVPEFTERLYGVSLGGPIVKDKIFFFANAEIRNDETPNPFNFEEYGGSYTREDLQGLANFLRSEYNYDPGSFDQGVVDKLEGLSLFGKLDFNINENHKLTLRHQYTKAENTNVASSNRNEISFSNNGIYFPSTTNSSAVELNSNIGNKYSNNLIVGYTRVVDDRDYLGTPFTNVDISDGSNYGVVFGSEPFSTANYLEQNIVSVTDNFKIYNGAHTFTLGTHNEFYSIENLFIPQNFYVQRFGSLEDFYNNNPFRVQGGYDNFSDARGDESVSRAEFNAMQLGFYVQDEWAVNTRLTLTGGLRVDIPVIQDDPIADEYFNTTALPEMRKQYEVANQVMAGQAPDGQLMFSPRLGFNYSMNDDRSTVLRGGLGVFTSRIPFVWPGAMFNTNGIALGYYFDGRPDQFYSDINDLPKNDAGPSGDVNLFVEDFKYPQIFRTNLAVDFLLPGDIITTVEGIYTKTLNNVVYTNINNDLNDATEVDGYTIYTRTAIDNTYRGVYVGSNTDEGYTYALTGTLNKNVRTRGMVGLNFMLSYTYGDAYALNEGTSSQNSSQWRGQVHIDGRNNPEFGRSDFATGHRLMGAAGLTLYWDDADVNKTNISFFLNGQTGRAYSYIIAGDDAENFTNETGSTSRNRTLVFIPANQRDINLVDITDSDGNVLISAAEQWTNLDNFIKDDPYLSEHRGEFAEKNSNFAPWETALDMAIRQDFGIASGENVHKLQLTLDVFNFLNMINKDWGVRYNVPGSFSYYNLYSYTGEVDDDGNREYNYTGTEVGKDAFNLSNSGSRWQMRVGVRYIFN